MLDEAASQLPPSPEMAAFKILTVNKNDLADLIDQDQELQKMVDNFVARAAGAIAEYQQG